MDIVKISSCSIILGFALPYFMNTNKDENEDEQVYKFQINRTPVSLTNPFKGLKELEDQTKYSVIGAISGMIIGRFIW